MANASLAASRPRRAGRVLPATGLALALSALPVSLASDAAPLGWQSAFAQGGRGGGDGPGNGAGRGGRDGGEHGRSGHEGGPGHHGRGHAIGHARDQGPGGRQGPRDYGSFAEFADHVRSGKAFGRDRQDERVEDAKGRYRDALEAKGGKRGKNDRHGVVHERAAGVAHRFSREETRALIERGWQGRKAEDGSFRHHGERVRTMVELAKELGYGARVGALQANFGTPQENGIAALEAELAENRAALNSAPESDPALRAELREEVARLEADLAAAIADAKPGHGPDDGWASADLDYNDDGVVDRRDLSDLEAAQERESAAGTAPATRQSS